MNGIGILLSTPGADVVLSGLRVIHLVGLVLGVGAATLLDMLLVRYLKAGEINAEQYATVRFAAQIVTVGLVVLWASGLAFLAHYWAFAPDKLGNPKIAAKLIIVGLLTINGVFIHAVVLPYLERSIGRRLFHGMSRAQRTAFLTSGAVSATSWYVPLVLGGVPQLNYVVPATTILLVYGALLVGAATTVQAIARAVVPGLAMVRIPRDEYESLLAAAGRVPARAA